MIENIEYFIFDIDGTIVQPWTTNMLRNRRAQLQRLKSQGKKIYLASNQGGPAYHAWHYYKKDNRHEEYPPLIKTISMMREITRMAEAERCYIALHPGADEVAQEVLNRITTKTDQIQYWIGDTIRSSWRPSWRKPAPGMIIAIMEEERGDREKYIYIGDETRDLLTAENAGIRFMDSDEFFLGRYEA